MIKQQLHTADDKKVVRRIQAQLAQDANRQGLPQKKVLEVGELQMDIGRRSVKVAGHKVSLTATEFEILRALMEQTGYVLTRGELIHLAMGSEFMGIERTLDSHIRNLRHKIEPNPKNPKYIKTVYGIGYRLEAEAET
jgi:DNA-binding response OmpR family regulator